MDKMTYSEPTIRMDFIQFMVMASKCAGMVMSRSKSLKLYLKRTLCILVVLKGTQFQCSHFEISEYNRINEINKVHGQS